MKRETCNECSNGICIDGKHDHLAKNIPVYTCGCGCESFPCTGDKTNEKKYYMRIKGKAKGKFPVGTIHTKEDLLAWGVKESEIMECDGQICNDKQSPYYKIKIPNLEIE